MNSSIVNNAPIAAPIRQLLILVSLFLYACELATMNINVTPMTVNGQSAILVVGEKWWHKITIEQSVRQIPTNMLLMCLVNTQVITFLIFFKKSFITVTFYMVNI